MEIEAEADVEVDAEAEAEAEAGGRKWCVWARDEEDGGSWRSPGAGPCSM